jgi:hypothetical protein
VNVNMPDLIRHAIKTRSIFLVKHNRSLKVAVQGLVLWPTLIHTYIYTYIFLVSVYTYLGRSTLTERWRNLISRELHGLRSSSNVIRVSILRERNMRVVGEMRSAHRMFLRKHEGKKPLRRPRHR